MQHNLPSQLTTFIGREREIADIARALQTARVLTLTGPGGAGKTRLAIEVACSLLDSYPDGVWVAELDALTDPALVVPTVALSLGLRERPDLSLSTTLIEWLSERRALLVLDNCEHLRKACATLVDLLIRECPDLLVLATSRLVLNIPEERTWRVPAMSSPNPNDLPSIEKIEKYEAVQLFVQRARQKQPDFKVGPENAHLIAQLCYALDGMPLAIELAAARISKLPIEEIVARLDERFNLLIGEHREAPSRQETLRAAIDWSYDLLPDEVQRLFRSLSVFAGGFSLDAIRGVFTERDAEYSALDLLPELLDQSLVIIAEWSSGDDTRYRMLDTIKQYASLKAREIGDAAALQGRHLQWYLGLAQEAEDALRGPEQTEWLERVQIEHDNFRVALAQSLSADDGAETALRLVKALHWFWYVRDHWTEGRRWIVAALARKEGLPEELPAYAYYGAGLLARRQGDYVEASKLFTEGLEMFRALGDKKNVAATLTNLGVIATSQGDYVRATRVLKESLAIKQELNDLNGVSVASNNLANIATDLGDYQLARQYLERSVEIQRTTDNRLMLAISLNNLGYIARCLGDYEQARKLVMEGLDIKRQLGNKAEIASSLQKLAEIEWCERNYDRAQQLCEEGLDLLKGVGDREASALVLNMLGEIARRKRDFKEARARYREALDESTARWIVPDALYNMGHAAEQGGDYKQAAESLQQSLQAYMEIGAKRGIAECLVSVAKIAVANGRLREAARLFGAASTLFETTGYKMHPDDNRELETSKGHARAKLGRGIWARAWGEGANMSLTDAAGAAVEEIGTITRGEDTGSRKGGTSLTKYPNGLTEREVAVIRLLAEGLPDAKIAEQLGVTANTVHSHLRSVYGKANVTTRSAAARFAMDNGLT